MRFASNVAGVLCLIAGCVWILQGINVLPGSFMTGQTKWAIYGGLLVIAGIGLLISANRRNAAMRDDGDLQPGVDKPTRGQYAIGAIVIVIISLAAYWWLTHQYR